MKLSALHFAFYKAIESDHRINPTHISIYMALLMDYSRNRFQNPVQLRRHKIMQRAKISSRTSYIKGLKELHEYGFIEYRPSFSVGASEVNLIELNSDT